ncbi:M20/M25/M40 family metallo-hydrolase [Acidobacteriota bacterium]
MKMMQPDRLARYVMLASAILVCFAFSSSAEEPSSAEGQIVEYVNQHNEEAVALLEKVVNISSGTMTHEGIRQVGDIFRRELDALGFDVRWIDMPSQVNRAGHLFAERRGKQGKRLLLIGHLDTVFEKDSPFKRFERDGHMATGPGVNDMKGGDVVILFALKALHHAGALDNTDIAVALIGDEEKVGKPISISRRDLIETAKGKDVALGFETGHERTVVTARRGSSKWTLTVSGTRGHSSRIFSDKFGSGAVFEASRILTAFHEKVRGERYLSFNPGVILGGTEVSFDPSTSRGTAFGKTNVIAQETTVNGGLRFITDKQKERARAKMRKIVVNKSLPGTSAKIVFRDAYPAMPPTEGNRALLKLIDQVSRDLGYEAMEAYDPGARGAADISFVAPYVDGLDGLGIYGSGAHTTKEGADLRSLPIATQRAAVLIYRLTRP